WPALGDSSASHTPVKTSSTACSSISPRCEASTPTKETATTTTPSNPTNKTCRTRLRLESEPRRRANVTPKPMRPATVPALRETDSTSTPPQSPPLPGCKAAHSDATSTKTIQAIQSASATVAVVLP